MNAYTVAMKPYRYSSTPELFKIYHYVLYCFIFLFCTSMDSVLTLRLKKAYRSTTGSATQTHTILPSGEISMFRFFFRSLAPNISVTGSHTSAAFQPDTVLCFVPPLQLTTAAQPTKQPFSVLDYHTRTPFLVPISNDPIVVVVVVRASLITFLSVTRETLQTPSEYITPDCN